jgi:hypothetical protein
MMSSLERGMRIRDEILKSTNKHLGDGAGSWDTDVYGEQGMWTIGAALEELVFEDWDDEPVQGDAIGTDT